VGDEKMNARNRDDALAKLEELAPIIIEHILKCLLFPESSAIAHWRAEIYRDARRLGKFNKGKKGRENFNVELVYEYLYTDRSDRLPLDFVDEYERDYGSAKDLNLHAVQEEVRAFYNLIKQNTQWPTADQEDEA
jgi:hypothetical protein